MHEVIELFDKPNEIQTSLPRYQNKTSCVEKGKTEGRKPQPLKMDKLKEQLQEKLMERLQRTKIERSICERQLEVIKPVMKSKSIGKYWMRSVKERSKLERLFQRFKK